MIAHGETIRLHQHQIDLPQPKRVQILILRQTVEKQQHQHDLQHLQEAIHQTLLITGIIDLILLREVVVLQRQPGRILQVRVVAIDPIPLVLLVAIADLILQVVAAAVVQAEVRVEHLEVALHQDLEAEGVTN
jgi:hypothetical protein